MISIVLTKDIHDGRKLSSMLAKKGLNIEECKAYTFESIIKDPEEFKSVKYVFSTWYMPRISSEDIGRYLPSLVAVFYAAGTVQYFAEPFLKNGIRIFTAAKGNGTPVAEFVTAQVILANKGYYLSQQSYKSIFWKLNFKRTRAFAESHPGNYDAKVGIIGFGTIGRQVASLLQPYNLKVFAYDPFVPDVIFRDYGVTRTDLSSLFKDCDVITNHLPDIPSTKGMLNQRYFSIMKDSVTFINTGRGSQVSEEDLSKALRRRKNACAVLDVTRHEPIFPWSPLLWNRKVFITPHIAGSLSNEFCRLVDQMLQAYEEVCHGKQSEFEVFENQQSYKA